MLDWTRIDNFIIDIYINMEIEVLRRIGKASTTGTDINKIFKFWEEH